MTRLILILRIIFIVFTIICILFCVEAHLRYKRKVGIDEDKDYTSKYQYFVQAIYDENDQLSGYELLIREYNPETKKWQLPKGVNDFPLNLVAEAVEKQRHQFKDSVRYIAINMTVGQLIDYRAVNFLDWVEGVLPNKIIILELDNKDVLSSTRYRRHQLMRDLKELAHSYPNIRVTIEDVDSSKESYKKLTRFLPWIDYIKFNADTFNKSKDHWIDVTLAQWQRELKKYHIQVILGKIETESQGALAKQLNINLREGYLYQRPQPIKEEVE